MSQITSDSIILSAIMDAAGDAIIVSGYTAQIVRTNATAQ